MEQTDCATVLDLTPFRLVVIDISDLELGRNTIRVIKQKYPDLAIIYCSEQCRGADILSRLWPDSDGGNPRVVDTNISRLRRKLAPAALTITNRSGIGYRLQPTTHTQQ